MSGVILQVTSRQTDWNCYIVQDQNHAVIVDCGNGPELLEEIRRRGLTCDYILLTHEHFDHIKGLEEVREALDVPVVACRLTSERIQDAAVNLSGIADVLAYFKTGKIPQTKSRKFTCRAADILYEDTFRLPWGDHTFRFQRIPGHSPGSTLISLDETDFFTGDYLICGEEEITRLKDGSEEDYQHIARPVLEGLPEGSRLYPGHGIVYTKGRTEPQAAPEAAAGA